MTRTCQVQSSFQLMQTIALGFVKLSILFYYRRVFNTPNIQRGIFDVLTKILIALTATWSIAFFFTLLFKCGTSIEAQWGTVVDLMEKCGSKFFLVEDAFGISDFLLDLAVLLLPIPKVGAAMLAITLFPS